MSAILTPREFAAYVRRLAGRFAPAAQRGLQSGAMRAVAVMHRRTDEAPPASAGGLAGAVDTGAYRRGWRTSVLPQGIRLYNSAPHGPVIEGGRRPGPVGRAGISNLQRWAKHKLHLTDAEARGAAFAIAKTLSRRPLRPRRVLAGAAGELAKVVREEVQGELEAELRGRK